jgi:uncharacterized NAD(P)/FAD-binding protein YdhS
VTTHVAVIGAGLAGTASALHLRRAGVAKVSLIDRGIAPGRGVAYGTRRPEHLLNVPARRMAVFPDDPDHFVRWLEPHGLGPEDYAERRQFGAYLIELLGQADGIDRIAAEAVDVEGDAVRLDDGRRIAADAFILALGNLRPAIPGGIDPAALGAAWVGDPWSPALAEGLATDAPVVLLGTALTAIDAVLTLDALGHRGPILAISRRGLAPRASGPREPMGAPNEPLPADALGLLRRTRRRGAEIGWRSAVHELRSVTTDLWRGATDSERRRFLRHLRPWWDVHRHRIAPAVGAAIDRIEAEGRLVFAAGRIVSGGAAAGAAFVDWQPRGKANVERAVAARIVNCTGPELDISRAGEALLEAMLTAERIRPDPYRLGIDVDPHCRAFDAAGTPSDRLFAIGPMTRGAFWESIAAGDIAAQAQAIARRIAGERVFKSAGNG